MGGFGGTNDQIYSSTIAFLTGWFQFKVSFYYCWKDMCQSELGN